LSAKSNFVIDIGNSRIKSATILRDTVSDIKYWDKAEELQKHRAKNQPTIISSVKHDRSQLTAIFGNEVFILGPETMLPIGINYDTPQTLGKDRIASAVAANYLFPMENLLIIDAGTCITYDLVIAGLFEGGLISPGYLMRLRAMHMMTAGLPDLSTLWTEHDSNLVGKSTGQCMVSGAKNGMLDEINGMISRFKEKYVDLKVIVTGGDTSLFESSLKEHIFVRSNLVLLGLNQILLYNENI
jgi:type III pantothenate kinase|tara:strand:- start:29891 stop:30616 length:726 start_codon:yes stop_codon:yes gene_type:complete